MSRTHLYIKNLCCNICVEKAQQLLSSSKQKDAAVSLGEIVFAKKLSLQEQTSVTKKLASKGFEIVKDDTDKKVVLIKASLRRFLERIVRGEGNLKLSAFLSSTMDQQYNKISRFFSSAENITIEKYFLKMKMERAKELLIQNGNSITDIAYMLGYNSSQTFSTQFKKVTGKTPQEYRLNPKPRRTHLDKF